MAMTYTHLYRYISLDICPLIMYLCEIFVHNVALKNYGPKS